MSDTTKPALPEPVAHIYPSDLERFAESETLTEKRANAVMRLVDEFGVAGVGTKYRDDVRAEIERCLRTFAPAKLIPESLSTVAEAAAAMKTPATPPRDEARDIADAARVIAWANESPRRPAHAAFTAGPERQAAYWIEWAQRGMDRVDVHRLIADCVPGGHSCDPQQVADAIREWFAP